MKTIYYITNGKIIQANLLEEYHKLSGKNLVKPIAGNLKFTFLNDYDIREITDHENDNFGPFRCPCPKSFGEVMEVDDFRCEPLAGKTDIWACHKCYSKRNSI